MASRFNLHADKELQALKSRLLKPTNLELTQADFTRLDQMSAEAKQHVMDALEADMIQDIIGFKTKPEAVYMLKEMTDAFSEAETSAHDKQVRTALESLPTFRTFDFSSLTLGKAEPDEEIVREILDKSQAGSYILSRLSQEKGDSLHPLLKFHAEKLAQMSDEEFNSPAAHLKTLLDIIEFSQQSASQKPSNPFRVQKK